MPKADPPHEPDVSKIGLDVSISPEQFLVLRTVAMNADLMRRPWQDAYGVMTAAIIETLGLKVGL